MSGLLASSPAASGAQPVKPSSAANGSATPLRTYVAVPLYPVARLVSQQKNESLQMKQRGRSSEWKGRWGARSSGSRKQQHGP